MSEGTLKSPESSKGDTAHALAKAGIAAIPIIGGSAAEVFRLVVEPPLVRRREEWMKEVGERLVALEGQGLNLQELQNDDRFISAVMHATHIAIRTHEETKLEALRNAIDNVAQGQSPEEALQHSFLDTVDALSELHIRILRIFENPTPPPNLGMGGLSHVLEHNIPELRGRREVYDQLWRDLYFRGLVAIDGLHSTMSGRGLAERRTTKLGDMFLEFISSS